MKKFSDMLNALPLTFRSLLAIWFCSMSAIPIGDWLGMADNERAVLVSATTLLFAAAALTVLHGAWGKQRLWRTLGLLLPATWLVEYVGSQTGWLFGRYYYTSLLQPQLGGVPLLIPFAWLTLLPASWTIANALTGQNQGWRFCLTAAAAFTSWDLFLDPQMVKWGLWTWTQPGQYFGIPLHNYLGWFVTAAILTALVRPSALPFAPPVLMYALTLAFEFGGLLLLFDLPGPAVVGGLVMGSILLAALYRYHFKPQHQR
jgi:uncharacterized membrane protein